MKILQVNVVFGTGSTGRIVADLHSQLLSDGHDALVFFGRMAGGASCADGRIRRYGDETEAHATAFFTRINGLQYTGAPLSTRRLIRAIDREQPDIVHLHCLNGYFVNVYHVFGYLKSAGFPVVLTLHAEFMHTGSCVHAYECDRWRTGCGKCPQRWSATKSWIFDRTSTAWRLMKESLDGFANLHIVSVSNWLHDRAAQSPIMSHASFHVIHNGMDTSATFRPHRAFIRSNRLKVRDDHRLLLHVTTSFNGRAGDPKGGRFVVELAESLREEPVTIVVLGNDSVSGDVPPNLIRLGRVDDARELAQWYSEADLTVVCSKGETFSMVTAESLCCGTPVVGFRAGGPESIAPKEFASFVPYGDVVALKAAVKLWLDDDFGKPSRVDISRWARSAFDQTAMYESYLNVYELAINSCS